MLVLVGVGNLFSSVKRAVAAFGLRRFNSFTLMLAWVGVLPSLVFSDESDAFFDDSFVHEIRLTFENANWYTTLYNSHASDPDDPYFPATFVGDGVDMGTIGVRFKGNSSFRINSIKKSFKLDFDQYDEENDDLRFFGLKKLNLNNGFKDPTMLREKLFLDFASEYVPTIRAVHTKVYVNDEYVGLYVAVEQIDKTFIESRFGSSEDGNLYKGAASDEVSDGPQSDFGSDLAWEGSSEEPYHDHYQLKTNEAADDYSGLVSFIDALNNEDPDSFPTTLEPLLNVDNALASIAINSLFMNLDSYTGSAHNYYLYQSDSTGQFHHLFWDANEAFGSFLQFWSGSNPLQTDPLWHPTAEPRPLMEQLWENDEYKRRYLQIMARMLREGFDATSIMDRANELADLIRADVYADSNKQYSNSAFESNLTSNYGGIYGLETFVSGRAEFLAEALDAYATQSDLRINEIAASEPSSWVELYNAGVGSVSLAGLYLSDSLENKTMWPLSGGEIDDGDFKAYWLSGDSSTGADRASFSLSLEGGSLYLFDSSGTLLDSVDYSELEQGVSYQRYSDGNDMWILSDRQSFEGRNKLTSSPSIVLYINEVMAQNDATIQDPSGTGYPDWIELYNPNGVAVDLGGFYLSDDSELPTQWRIPDGVVIDAKGYLVFWCDNDEEQGPTHTSFKLSTEGEEIGLFESDLYGNVPIDLVTFGLQTADVSYGREPDGGTDFAFYTDATPGFGNAGVEILSELASYYVGVGYSMRLEVAYEGEGDLAFQWYRDGVAIPEAVEATIDLNEIGADNAGVYSVTITRGTSDVNGEIAVLKVETLDPSGDEDGDGVSNELESVFGMDRNAQDSELLPRFKFDDGAISLVYSVFRDDYECVVDVSSDLSNWLPLEPIATESGLWSYRSELDDEGARFYRMRLMKK